MPASAGPRLTVWTPMRTAARPLSRSSIRCAPSPRSRCSAPTPRSSRAPSTRARSSGHFAMRLEVGVAIFFCISGFLLYRPFVRRARATAMPAVATGAYAWRRFLRIVPAYWAGADAVGVVAGHERRVHRRRAVDLLRLRADLARGDDRRRADAGVDAVHRDRLLRVPAGLGAGHAPRGALAAGRGDRRSARCSRSRVAWKVVVLAAGPQAQIRVTPALLALPAYLDEFALGMGLAVLSLWLRDVPEPRWARLADWSWALAAVAFVVVSIGIGIGDRLFEAMTPEQYLARHYLYALIGIAMLAPAVLGTARGGPVRARPGQPRAGLAGPGVLRHLPLARHRARPARPLGLRPRRPGRIPTSPGRWPGSPAPR